MHIETIALTALRHYRESVVIWENTPDDALALTARHFGLAEATAARAAFEADPALRELTD